MLKLTGLSTIDFTQLGLLNIKPEIRLKLYYPFIEKLEKYGIKYSIADNDLHYLGNNFCCCGDDLVYKSTRFNTTALSHIYGKANYTRDVLNKEIDDSGVSECDCSQCFTSNRTMGVKTVRDSLNRRFGNKNSPFSPKFFYPQDDKYLDSNSYHRIAESLIQDENAQIKLF